MERTVRVDLDGRHLTGHLGGSTGDKGSGCPGQEDRAVRDGADGDAGIGDPPVRIEADRDGHCGQREVAVALRHFEQGAAFAGTGEREADLDDEFTGLERGGEEAGEEFAGRDVAASARSFHHHGAAEGQEGQRQFGGGVGVGDRAADRAAVPGGDVADDGEAVGEGPDRRRLRREFEGALACEGADDQRAVDRFQPVETRRPLRSTTTAGAASRRLSIGTRLCPPARGRASSPCSARRSSASASPQGRS
jgi:hypothetical protein